jgi:selT/selW/selH-like putative selenoprotein|mmetsp:Transcript_9365/g.16867  ORF Transcript_9365/g.16867 Transcript_9365/m.16867 type:complete len:99 (-) Transcript_9365:25-321(-)
MTDFSSIKLVIQYSGTCGYDGRWYLRSARMAQEVLQKQLPGLVVQLEKDEEATDNFEVVCANNGAVLHSKSKQLQGFLDEPDKLAAVREAVRKIASAY